MIYSAATSPQIDIRDIMIFSERYYKQTKVSESSVLDFSNYRKIKLVDRFNSLKEKWVEETKIFSSLSTIYNHPAYEEIIKMGEDALPLIYHDSTNNDNFWFKALQNITGVNLTTKENQGRFQLLKKAWINWIENNFNVKS